MASLTFCPSTVPSLPNKQLRIAELMREGRTQLEAAEHLKISDKRLANR